MHGRRKWLTVAASVWPMLLPTIFLAFLLDAATLDGRQATSGATLIEWTNERKLGWQDFAMKPPRQSGDDCHSWVGFDAEWVCEASGFMFHVRTTFDPNQSWVKPQSRDPALLRHEQTHFDLTELSARQLRKRLSDLDQPCRSFLMTQEIDRAITEYRQVWEQDQKLYDKETVYGTNPVRQRLWEERTRQRLQELESFK
jgi:hypothetical protein